MTRSPRSSIEGRRRRALVALLALLALPARSGGVTPAELRHQAQAVLADDRYQRSLPGAAEGRAGEPGRSGTPGREREEEGGGFAVDGDPEEVAPEPVGLSALSQLLFWALVAAAAGLAALWFARVVVARREADPPQPAPPDGAAPPRPRQPPPLDSAELAAQGRYAEAVHALLLAAIALLARRFRLPLPPSRTSRELLRAVPLTGAPQEAFAGLVRTVEQSWFGGAPVGPAEYQESVERFRGLAERTGRGA